MAARRAGMGQRVGMAERQVEMAARQAGTVQQAEMAAQRVGTAERRAEMAARQAGTREVGMAQGVWMAAQQAGMAAQ